MIMREQVLQGFEEQRVLVDALTNVSSSLLQNQSSNILSCFKLGPLLVKATTSHISGSTIRRERQSD